MSNRFMDAFRSGKSETKVDQAPETPARTAAVLRTELAAAQAPETPARTAAVLRAELAAAQAATEPLVQKSQQAQADLVEARARYDRGIQTCTLGQSSSEPDRGELQNCIARADALRRVSQDISRRVASLISELAAAELQEANAAGRDRLPALAARARARLDEFLRAVNIVREVEDHLFSALFDEQNGLKQILPSVELCMEAQKIRFEITKRAQQGSLAAGYALYASFETDGNPNLGPEYAISCGPRRPADGPSQQAARRQRLSKLIEEKGA